MSCKVSWHWKSWTFLETHMFEWYKFLFTTVSLVVLISKVPKTAPCWRSNTQVRVWSSTHNFSPWNCFMLNMGHRPVIFGNMLILEPKYQIFELMLIFDKHFLKVQFGADVAAECCSIKTCRKKLAAMEQRGEKGSQCGRLWEDKRMGRQEKMAP